MKLLNEYMLEDDFLLLAAFYKEKGLIDGNLSLDEISNLLKTLANEKYQKECISDSSIEYNDEILSIEDIGELETIDITVTGDNLFYCNNILTKNSIGLAATMDFMAGIIQPPELFEQRKYLFKNIKSRFDSNINQIVTVGIDYEKMRLYNLENDQQEIPISVKDKLKQNQQVIDSQNDTIDFDFN